MSKLPKEIYVQREQDGDTDYLLAWEDREEINDGEVGVYELKKVGKKSTKTLIDY